MWTLYWLWACTSGPSYILTGVVVERPAEHLVVVDHEKIPGFMDAMTMEFMVRDRSQLEGVNPGDRITARLEIDQEGAHLARVRVTGHGPPPARVAEGPRPIRPGERFPRRAWVASDGQEVAVGGEQGGRKVLTFFYSTCPLPEFCPALVGRLLELAPRLPPDAEVVMVSLDPTGDTPEVLQAWREKVGLPANFRLVQPTPEQLVELAQQAALHVNADGRGVQHGLRLLVLDQDGRLIERYDDNRWPIARVADQLATGGPPAPAGSDGTLTPAPG